MATPDPTPYCVCQQTDGAGIMIECIRGSGGCNGWVHPSCCGLILTQEELEAWTHTSAHYAKRERKRKLQPAKPVKKPWICAACQHPNRDRRTRECEACHTRRVMTKKPKDKALNDDDKSRLLAQQLQDERRHSKRSANRKRKSYHVPNSDEDIASSDSDNYKKKHKKHKKRPRDEDDSESDEAEFQLDTSKLKHEAKPAEDQVAVANMVIDKIMGARQREVVEPAPVPPADSASANLFANRPAKTSITEYLIKWKGFAYMHASWETKQVLLDLDPLTNKQKIKRFHEKEQHRLHYPHRQTGDLDEDSLAVDELEYFNPEYLEIHRIIAHRQDAPMPADPNFPDAPVDDGMRYYIKWRILPYTDATWERACDIKDDAALAKYKASIVVPDEEVWKPRPRPSIREYRKLEESPRFGEDQSLSLRAYQLEGLNWLLWNWYNERPSILADEMGLGKTIQTLSFLNLLRDDPKIKIRGPFLIVAPLSLIVQWQNECEMWTTMNCVVYHGNSASREIIRDFEFSYLDEKLRPDKKKAYRFNILVTTYEVAIKDIAVLSKIRWRCLVVEKPTDSRTSPRDLREIVPSVSDFLEKFGDLHEAQQVADLHKMLKPYLLRRVKEDVEKSLPPKEETIVEVELTPVQKQWYRAIYERNTSFLNRGGNPRNVPNLMNVMMELRKCCNHPYLNNGVEEILNEGLTTDTQRHEMMVKCCGKMVLIDKLLPRLNDGGHKVLIFSQMASLKLGLDKAVLTHMRRENEEEGGKKRNKSSKAQESKEIDELLKRGAYDVFRDDDNAGEQFCALDIDQILQRSSQIVQYTEQASQASPRQQRKRTRVARFGDGGSFSDGSISDDEYDQEKRDKEKEERERLEEKSAPREWTQNGRDRLQRALMHYGFGRWEIIRSQSGGSRSVKEVERFARGFIYVSALACDQRKDDSTFVKASIHAATYAQKENLIDEEELSPVLKEEDFVLKSKQGGGRRVVVRLDMLQRLQQLVTTACDMCDDLYKEDEDSAKPRPSPAASIDERAGYYGVDKLVPHIELVDVGERPVWTQITPWWNEDADRNLLMGVFLHGYGRCAQILADPRLYFARLEKAARDQVDASNGNSSNQTSSAPLPASKEGTTSAEDGDVDMSDSESASSSANDDSSSKSNAKTEAGDVTAAASSFKQPEVQHMNRLLGWLLSAEEIKRRHEKEKFKKERVAMEQRRQIAQEMRARTLTLRRLELKAMQLAQVDILRHMAVLHNARQLPDATVAPRRIIRAVVAPDGRATPSMLPFVTEQARDFSWETDSISWRNVVEWGNLNKTATMARTFYETKFAPKCHEVARMRADPLGSDQRAVALGDLIGIEFVDAYEGVLAHGLKARNTAWVTMRRTQLLEDVLDILSTKRVALEAYLKSGQENLVTDMPVWWCPWIHDLGVFTAWLATFPSLSILERKVETICAAVLEEFGSSAERYVEPEERREFSLSPPGNCFEELVLSRVKQEEELLPSIESLSVSTSREEGNALSAFLSESQCRRDEFLRAADASNAIGSLTSSAAANGASAVVANGQDEQQTSSQIPIQMLVL
ncbi:P-loop containing nucleoside triphosphate hydrolase [Phytophthora cactorum]|nr:P-loop containing nucleoside triphosphate hydrolase [Phytophthora cactorum]